MSDFIRTLKVQERKAVLERLKAARAILGPNGEKWISGNLRNGRNYCAMGALSAAERGIGREVDYHGDRTHTLTTRALASVLPTKHTGLSPKDAVVSFNDGGAAEISLGADPKLTPSVRARKQILKAFDKAICEVQAVKRSVPTKKKGAAK